MSIGFMEHKSKKTKPDVLLCKYTNMHYVATPLSGQWEDTEIDIVQ